MKNNKNIFILILTMAILAAILCSCTPIATNIYKINLYDSNGETFIEIGEFRLASVSNDEFSKQFEVLLEDKEDFINLLQESEYYIGTYSIDKSSYYLSKSNRCTKFRGEDNCMWFTAEGKVWVGKFHTNKLYIIAPIPSIKVRSNDLNINFSETLLTGDLIIDFSEALFTGNEKPNDLFEEFKSAVSWEQLKSIYINNIIDEANHTIELEGMFFDSENTVLYVAKTLLYFDNDKNTIKISDQFYLDGLWLEW